ncbi:hypothetical protein B0T11DRAFT_140159 [Plectosphaerella cucumerina]|uniref:Uncharacterized protein n=1 Tax=Plectosphaerella cucumerina TaxID=40658 RepID=A0A8K0T9M0_9PEZI|nr:hypothetical protein B0T11DRAFT_140159 [Plectosphaerella cucumerina]
MPDPAALLPDPTSIPPSPVLRPSGPIHSRSLTTKGTPLLHEACTFLWLKKLVEGSQLPLSHSLPRGHRFHVPYLSSLHISRLAFSERRRHVMAPPFHPPPTGRESERARERDRNRHQRRSAAAFVQTLHPALLLTFTRGRSPSRGGSIPPLRPLSVGSFVDGQPDVGVELEDSTRPETHPIPSPVFSSIPFHPIISHLSRACVCP